MLKSLCSGWEFTESWSESFAAFSGAAEAVRLPHSVRPLPQNYALPDDYEMVCGYRRCLDVPPEWAGKRLFLQFDGAAHIAELYVNGRFAASHGCGYTAFRAEITDLVRPGGENRVAVKLDCTENPSVPPFGFVIDYLTYGGLYREAWLDVREQSYIRDLFVIAGMERRAVVRFEVDGPYETARVRILDGETVLAEGEGRDELTLSVPAARLWDPGCPQLYRCEVSLPNGDAKTVSFGFRSVEFTAESFLLNGRPYFLRGLNRHQCWPTIGYAAPESLQREDARILSEELQLTAVRTSHYPQSHYFLDECDRRGLLVFTEIPGWQHIGNEEWKDRAVENVREMVTQYRNHPSIVLWGVRINESQDDDAFYRRTNALAHELDPSRPTSGVRYLEKSSLLEDVYAYNDFSHKGNNPGCKSKDKVTPDMSKALLISEHNGHMFPTKSYDTYQRRQEQALRHARVLNAALADGAHVGCFGWCMFDYATHKDFGSGNRVCYHGVMDAFRNPKLAAATYASQGEGRWMLELGSSMDIGDYPGGETGEIYAFTNAECVELYKNDAYVATFRPKGWKGLKHGPVLIDDKIGELLRSQEGFEPMKAKLLHDLLLAAEKNGLANMSPADKLKMGAVMLRYGMSMADGVALYGKYVGNWGGEATRWRFDAKVGGKTVASVTRAPGAKLRLKCLPSSRVLHEGDRYDMAAVRVRVVDDYGNVTPYAQLPLHFSVEGAAELCSPADQTAEGGMSGCYVRSAGRAGKAVLHISAPQAGEAEIEFEIVKENNDG